MRGASQHSSEGYKTYERDAAARAGSGAESAVSKVLAGSEKREGWKACFPWNKRKEDVPEREVSIAKHFDRASKTSFLNPRRGDNCGSAYARYRLKQTQYAGGGPDHDART